MNAEIIERILLTRHALRIGSETALYIQRRLAEAANLIEVMGIDARTGVPEKRFLAAAALLVDINLALEESTS